MHRTTTIICHLLAIITLLITSCASTHADMVPQEKLPQFRFMIMRNAKIQGQEPTPATVSIDGIQMYFAFNDLEEAREYIEEPNQAQGFELYTVEDNPYRMKVRSDFDASGNGRQVISGRIIPLSANHLSYNQYLNEKIYPEVESINSSSYCARTVMSAHSLRWQASIQAICLEQDMAADTEHCIAIQEEIIFILNNEPTRCKIFSDRASILNIIAQKNLKAQSRTPNLNAMDMVIAMMLDWSDIPLDSAKGTDGSKDALR